VLGAFRGPGINVRMSETPGEVRRPRVLPDADRASILADAAKATAPSTAAAPEAIRTALEGVKVIDLCIVLAGPTCGRLPSSG
jgi:crotonobetainyl-CoA:carnitine CoA-transferase CaiB-like acyl-CoA transferase